MAQLNDHIKQVMGIENKPKYKKDYTHAKTLANKSLSLPIGSHLTMNDIRIVASKINQFFAKN